MKERQQKTCRNCGKPFTPKSGTQENCSSGNSSCYLERMRKLSARSTAFLRQRREAGVANAGV